MMISL